MPVPARPIATEIVEYEQRHLRNSTRHLELKIAALEREVTAAFPVQPDAAAAAAWEAIGDGYEYTETEDGSILRRQLRGGWEGDSGEGPEPSHAGPDPTGGGLPRPRPSLVVAGNQRLGSMAISRGDERLVAYTADAGAPGGERFNLYVRDIDSGDVFNVSAVLGPSPPSPSVTAVEWADGDVLYLAVADTQLRASEVWRVSFNCECGRLALCSAPKRVLREDDLAFFVDLGRTKDRQFITLRLSSKTTSEVVSARDGY